MSIINSDYQGCLFQLPSPVQPLKLLELYNKKFNEPLKTEKKTKLHVLHVLVPIRASVCHNKFVVMKLPKKMNISYSY